MRIKSALWVAAYLRRCENAFAPAVIVRRGADMGGAIYLKVSDLAGSACVYAPVPDFTGEAAERVWMLALGAEPVAEQRADAYLADIADSDPDAWIIEVEDKEQRNFLDGAVESI